MTILPSDVNEALRKHVERAVRPVRAGKVCKLRMREELLAYLTAIYTEENARQGAPAALATALDRFGDPGALSRELDSSVHLSERVAQFAERIAAAMDRMFAVRAGQSWWQYAARAGAALVAFNLLVFTLVFGLNWLINGPSSDPSHAAPFVLAILVHSVCSELAFLFAVRATYQALYGSHRRPRWLTAGLTTCAWSSVFLLMSVALWWAITRSLDDGLKRMPTMAFYTFAFLPPILLFVAWITHDAQSRARVYQEWTRLQIGE